MINYSTKLVRIKLLIIVLTTFSAVFVDLTFAPKTQKVRASVAGPTASHTNAPGEANCTTCHADFPVNSGTGGIVITGIPANYLPNQQIPLTVTVNEANAVLYGFQMTAIDNLGRRAGMFSFPTQNPEPLQLTFGLVGGNTREYIQHTSNGVTPTVFGTKSWTFTWTAPAFRVGKVSFHAAGNGANSDGDTSGDYIYTGQKTSLSGSAIANFDGDLSSDLSVFRPSTGTWYSLNSSDGNFQAVQFGAAGDKIVSADYDGDGISDFAVWRPSTGTWYVLKSTGGFLITQFGATGDVPVVGDYDGDLKSDIAVWRPSTGVWYILRSSNGSYDIRQFGVSTDKIAQGDFDADGKTDIAVWRPSTGTWYVWRSTNNNFIIVTFGQNGDLPVQGDYDGDGRADPAVFRPSNGTWYLLRSRDGFSASQFGNSTDKPAPGDFDGDGKFDIAVYRNGTWYVLRSSDSGVIIANFGTSEDIPAPTSRLAQ